MNPASKKILEELLFPIKTNQHEQDVVVSKHILAAFLCSSGPLVRGRIHTRKSEASAEKDMAASCDNDGKITLKKEKAEKKHMAHTNSPKYYCISIPLLVFFWLEL
jgi:hypothetical protein